MDDKVNMTDEEVMAFVGDDIKLGEIPEYVYDVHTIEGKTRGKTKKDFFRDEEKALKKQTVINVWLGDIGGARWQEADQRKLLIMRWSKS